ncbi:MAG: hypothetical protein ACOYN0_03175 [Phycisphaerales bacterium]
MKSLVACTLAVALVAPALVKFRTATEQHARAREQLAAVTRDAAELQLLQSASSPVSSGPRPQPGLASRVTDALAEAGVDASALRSLAPDPQAVPLSQVGGPLFRQTARLALEPMTLPRLGAFLTVWSRSSPEWTVASIRLAPLQDEPGRVDHPIRAELTIESIYVDDGSPKP